MKRSRAAYEKKDPNADFVVYGTPLPSFDPDVRDDGSFVPIWKQEVTDERGRKRLHGAFTGGFSAGYFNTVGSKEGWTPSTFKSSRDARAKAVAARPEDFMDEEDFAAAEDEKIIHTNRNFSGLGSTPDGLAARANFTVMDLFKPPPEETMGVKLLKKMGWKEGQGIGPKVKRPAMVSDDNASQKFIRDEQFHYFAPTNSALITLQKKDDYKGLGYSGSLKQDDSIQQHRLQPIAPKAPARRGGFGVGVLNEEDEDDEDIYEIKPKATYNRVIGGDKKKSTKGSAKVSTSTPGRHVFISRKVTTNKSGLDTRKCFDGRLPLTDFVLATESTQSQNDWYAPPEVPDDWTPGVSQGLISPDSLPLSQSPNGPNSNIKLDPQMRGAILGETPLPGKSVFDFMSPAARERIVAATGRTNLPQALSEAPPPGYAPASPADLVPKMDKAVALGALNGGYMPYSDDLDKRVRYRKFLEVQAGLREGLPDKRPGMSNGDWVNELNEFANCARIFKPASGMISTRFTSSTSTTSQIKTSEGVISSDPDVLVHRPAKKEQSSAEQAAAMGMYGGLTRVIDRFWPTRLLCKRFNVKPPKHVEPAGNPEHEGASSLSTFDAATFMQQSRNVPTEPPKETSAITEMMRKVKGDINYAPTVDVDVEINEALEGERAADDVFKAIFGDDDDDDDGDDDFEHS